jgi:DNA-binding response OmpR family regulator
VAAAYDGEVIRSGALEVRPGEGLVLADGHVLAVSVRELGLLVALARRAGRIVSRSELSEVVWGRSLKAGDRTVDVYVHKVRTKLETALPQWQFIHTHVGFGYRFAPEASHAFHNSDTDR